MWPRLVASKILKKRLGSNNFVADIPSISDDPEEFLVETIPPRFDDDHQKSLSSNHILAHHQETQSYNHLASGGREGDEKFRNSNAAEILSRTTFPKGPSHELPRKIQDHDRVIFLGDLNYRISLQETATRLLIDKGDFNALLEYDQLRSEMLDGQVFKGWHEGIIKFAPTYKYYPNSDGYYGGVNGKKGEKKRAPAWCDRIIWFGEGLKQHKYGRGESKLSDHRPVRAIFSAEVKVSKIKKLRNFFLSERFEHITHRLEGWHNSTTFLPERLCRTNIALLEPILLNRSCLKTCSCKPRRPLRSNGMNGNVGLGVKGQS
nr:type IV inositol polyphosphate 5-phosphatase 9 isoform X2 [Ipomoea trifida]